MYVNTKLTQNENSTKLETIAAMVQSAAKNYQGDSLTLLALLRLLETLHREIRNSLFLESLLSEQQALYALLKNIEKEGGWPYIYRMKLQSLLKNLAENTLPELEVDKTTESLVEVDNSEPFSRKQGEIA